jgi:alginate O-acetyltransferase complex protein AlgI
MVFTAPIFIFLFLPFVLIVNTVLRSILLKNLFLLAVSFFFYYYGERENFYLIIVSIVVNYVFGLCIDYFSNARKSFVVAGVFFNLSLLFFYKYFNFLIGNINNISSFFSLNFSLNSIQNITLPVGISFFTFHGLSYLLDVYRLKCFPQRNLLNLGLYLTVFPQLIAGPIVRYHEFSGQLFNRKSFSIDYKIGIERFIHGLAKKLILANSFAYVADGIFNLPMGQLSQQLAWLGAISYSLQIYFDFSGYSDMAIGLARLIGFKFPENFNYPYISDSIKEFWRRWHISLSTWFRDYLYIPLGGSFNGQRRTIRNLLFVFIVTGLWHGASLNFIVWGLIHGLFVVLESLFLGRFLKKLGRVFRILYTNTIVVCAWVFFRGEDLGYDIHFIRKMFDFSFSNQMAQSHFIYYFNWEYASYVLAGCLFATPIWKVVSDKIVNRNKVSSSFYRIFLIILLIICLAFVAAGTYNPFIYFRF